LDLSIIIVNWNTRDMLMDCLGAVFETVKGVSFEVWLVDNGSTDGSVEAAKGAYPSIHTISNKENLGFAAANNQAFRRMAGKYALLVNTDALLTHNAVKTLYDFMEARPGTGMACGQLLNRDGSKQNSIASFPSLWALVSNETLLRVLFPKKFPSKRWEYVQPLEVDSCIGACMILRKTALDAVGLFDERYFFFLEETDMAYKMKQAGWKVYFVPEARIFHFQGKSVGKRVDGRIMYYRSRYAFFKKWYGPWGLLAYPLVFFRLLINALLNLLAVLGTLGLQEKPKRKLSAYTRLITWHLQGCPGGHTAYERR